MHFADTGGGGYSSPACHGELTDSTTARHLLSPLKLAPLAWSFSFFVLKIISPSLPSTAFAPSDSGANSRSRFIRVSSALGSKVWEIL